MKRAPVRKTRAVVLASALVAPLVWLAGCKRTPPPPALRAVPAPEKPLAPGKPLVFAPAERGFGVALPEGCTERSPTLRAPLGDRRVYFVAGDHPAGALVVVDRGEPAAVTVPYVGAANAAPAFDAAAPSIAHDGRHFLGVYGAGPADDRTIVVGDGSTRHVLATGDALSPIDFRCRDGVCAVLLPRVGKVASPGATLFSRNAAGQPWVRRDVDLGENERATAIAGLGEGRPTAVVTAIGTDVLVRSITDGAVRPHEPLPVPHGVLDVAVFDRAVAIAHGAKVVGNCAEPKPLATLVREGLPAVSIPVSAPVTNALLRPLGKGGLLVYAAAVRCHDDKHRFVNAQLLDAAGAPVGPSMAIAEARGFAVSTAGDDLDLAVLRESEIVVARARCTPR